MKFSEDYVDLVENIIILITVALWEIPCRIVSFIQIPAVEGHWVTMVMEKECLE